MNSNFSSTQESPATYQITIRGFLQPAWSDRLAGMEINNEVVNNDERSVLTGTLIDQSELHGVLSTLFNQNYSLISVIKLNEIKHQA